METKKLVILSYHQFVKNEDPYPFSRTYDQFWHDIRKKVYDWITIDDGMACAYQACEMMREINQRAKLFICTGLVDKPGYLTWDQINKLSQHHDIENHGNIHLYHNKMHEDEVKLSIQKASDLIKVYTGKQPRYFVAPYNNYDHIVRQVAEANGLICLEDRITIKNFHK